eukprot:COSAG05_NODE_1328_length_5166_cov_4.355634_5_plen_54_part_00
MRPAATSCSHKDRLCQRGKDQISVTAVLPVQGRVVAFLRVGDTMHAPTKAAGH